jgi:hypothetical protein
MDNPDTGNIGHKAENEHKQRCNQEWTIQTQATLVTKHKTNTNKGVIKNGQSRHRQHWSQNRKWTQTKQKKTQHRKLRRWATSSALKTGMNPDVPEWRAFLITMLLIVNSGKSLVVDSRKKPKLPMYDNHILKYWSEQCSYSMRIRLGYTDQI